MALITGRKSILDYIIFINIYFFAAHQEYSGGTLVCPGHTL